MASSKRQMNLAVDAATYDAFKFAIKRDGVVSVTAAVETLMRAYLDNKIKFNVRLSEWEERTGIRLQRSGDPVQD